MDGAIPWVEGQLVTLLFEDRGLEALCKDGFEKSDAEQFERNLRRLLETYFVDLCREATCKPEVMIIPFFKSRVPSIASIIRRNLEPNQAAEARMIETRLEEDTQKEQLMKRNLSQFEILDGGQTEKNEAEEKETEKIETKNNKVDVDSTDPEDHDDPKKSSTFVLEQVKQFMIDGNAFEKLREDLMVFVFPLMLAAQNLPELPYQQESKEWDKRTLLGDIKQLRASYETMLRQCRLSKVNWFIRPKQVETDFYV